MIILYDHLICQVNKDNRAYFESESSIWDNFEWCLFTKYNGAIEISILDLEEMKNDAKEKGFLFICPW